MKHIYLTLSLLTVFGLKSYSQTTLTEDANGVLNTSRIVAQTVNGQIFYIGHQTGSTYSYPSAGIFRAITDNPNGTQNYFYDGVINGNTSFSVRADGQGFFSGYVGIGTSAPTSNLQVFEPSSDSRPGGTVAPTKSVFKLSRIGTPSYSYNESAEFRIGHGGPGIWGSQLDLYINGSANTSNVPDQQVMTWLYNGYVGIGTTTPGGKLDISSQTQSGTSDIMEKYTWGGDLINWGLRVEQQFNAPLSRIQYNWMMKNGTTTDVQVMSFAGGNIGIGTTNPQNKLDVNGTVHSKQVNVDMNGWNDYVFYNSYNLPSLSEVKSYIDRNHHLPEIPSEQEIVKDGLNLGEMNKLLMKKVEELTLYLIEQQKTNQNLQEQINELKNQRKLSDNK